MIEKGSHRLPIPLIPQSRNHLIFAVCLCEPLFGNLSQAIIAVYFFDKGKITLLAGLRYQREQREQLLPTPNPDPDLCCPGKREILIQALFSSPSINPLLQNPEL